MNYAISWLAWTRGERQVPIDILLHGAPQRNHQTPPVVFSDEIDRVRQILTPALLNEDNTWNTDFTGALGDSETVATNIQSDQEAGIDYHAKLEQQKQEQLASMQPATIITTVKHTLQCPHCNRDSGKCIDHLLDVPAWRAVVSLIGRWYCKACGKAFTGMILEDRSVVLRRENGYTEAHNVLLVIPPQDEPIFFVIPKHKNWVDGKAESDEETKRHFAYFFDSHSCPANWIRHIERMQIDSDNDPHGVILYADSHLDAVIQDAQGNVIACPGINDYFPELNTAEGRAKLYEQAIDRDEW